MEQQRIHIKELTGNLTERARARLELKAMIEQCRRLRAAKRHFKIDQRHGKRSP